MTSLVTEQFHAPTGRRDARAHDRARRRTIDRLAGRTVWSAALELPGYLEWARDAGVTARSLEVPEHYHDEEQVVAGVRPADIVVLSAPPSAALTRAIRDRGAHALWHLHGARTRTEGIDAFILSARTASGALIVAAVIPSVGTVAVKEVRGASYRDMGWGCVLADVVETDRDEAVGGTLRPRPVVPVR